MVLYHYFVVYDDFLGTSTLKCITRPFIRKITHDIEEIRVEPN
jgi:hypothetical protein